MADQENEQNQGILQIYHDEAKQLARMMDLHGELTEMDLTAQALLKQKGLKLVIRASARKSRHAGMVYEPQNLPKTIWE